MFASLLRALADEVRGLDHSPKALRRFGLVVGGVFLGIAAVGAWRSGWTLGPGLTALAGVGGALVAVGLVAPALLRPVFFVWMGLAVVLGSIMTRVLLTVVFVLAVVPIGLGLRLVGKDLLHRRPDPEAPSYWLPKTYDDPSPARLEKYY
jgi:hypothetical protein